MKNKRKKISILNILFLILTLTLITSLVFKNREKFKNIFTKKNKIKSPQETNLDKLEIGDIVYYDHKRVVNKADETKQTVTIPVGDSATPGSGDEQSGDQIFNAKSYNTTWRVWDKLSDGRVMLVSNRGVANVSVKAAVGHIWWEHTAHKISSIFGYGEGADVGITKTGEATGANKDFPYKVGSGIDSAPDMNEGDKGDWKIGEEPQDKINVSAARSLTLPEVEKKLGITDEGIKNKTTTSMTHVVQRDIDSSNQLWENEEDRKKGKAKNKTPNGYKMTRDRYYFWNKNLISATKYKDMLFNGINGYISLATNSLDVYEGLDVNFGINYVASHGLGSANYLLKSSYYSGWGEYAKSPSLRVAIYLKSKIKYLPAGANAWDIYQATSVDKNLKLKVLNLSSALTSNIGVKIDKVDKRGIFPEDATGINIGKREISGKIEYTVKTKKFSGYKREKTGDDTIFTPIDNKYNVEITGIPAGYDFKIIGKTGKQIDLSTDTNPEYELVIYPKPSRQNISVEYVGGANDSSFATTGNVLIKFGNEILGRKDNVTLKRGVSTVQIDNVDLFNKTNNTLKNYTVEFNKSTTDKSLHTVTYNTNTKKLVVTYKSPNKSITVSVAEDSKKYLKNITEIKLRLVGGQARNISLKPSGFSTNISVPERDTTGKLINYSLQKAGEVPGYYLTINGFKVNLKPILKLPYTGTELSSKNITIISLGMFGLALLVRFRKRIVFIFKEYTIMK